LSHVYSKDNVQTTRWQMQALFELA
jgi:hypothetical protein